MPAPNAIQDRIVAQLLLNPYFSDAAAAVPRPVTFITADDGDIEAELERRLAIYEGSGLAVTTLIPFGQQEDSRSGVTWPTLQIEIAATENVLINRGEGGMNKKAYDVIRKIIAPWKRDNTGGLNAWNPGPPFTKFEFTEFGEFGVKTKSGKSLLLYRALFNTTEVIE